MGQDPPQDRLSDQQLIAAANAGSDRAFETLYRRYRDWVVALAYRVTHNRDDALDVLQDTFTYLLGKFPGFVLTCRMKTFLYPVVRNLAIRRREKAQRAGQSQSSPEDLPAPDAQQSDDDLVRLLAVLPAGQRQVLVMRFVDGLPLADIALALDIPLGTVKSRLHHALAALRNDERVGRFFSN